MPLPYRILVVQLATAVVASSLLWLKSVDSALAAMTAAVVVIVPNAWFAWRVVTGVGHDPIGNDRSVAAREAALEARTVALGLLRGGVAKLFATVGLIALAIVWVRPQPLAFFGTLIALQAVYLFAPLLDGPSRSRRRGPSA